MSLTRRNMLLAGAAALLSEPARPAGKSGSGMITLSDRPADLEMPVDGFIDEITPVEHFFGLWNILSYHVTPCWDVNFRTEWYDDAEGGGYPGGSGFRNNYYEVTLGLDYPALVVKKFRLTVASSEGGNLH